MKKLIIFLLISLMMVGSVFASIEDNEAWIKKQTSETGSWYDKLKINLGLMSTGGDLECCTGCQPTQTGTLGKGMVWNSKCSIGQYGVVVNTYKILYGKRTYDPTEIRSSDGKFTYTCPSYADSCGYECYSCNIAGDGSNLGINYCNDDTDCYEYAKSKGLPTSNYFCDGSTCRQNCDGVWGAPYCKDGKVQSDPVTKAGCTTPTQPRVYSCNSNQVCKDGSCVSGTTDTVIENKSIKKSWDWDNLANFPVGSIEEYKCTKSNPQVCPSNSFCFVKSEAQTQAIIPSFYTNIFKNIYNLLKGALVTGTGAKELEVRFGDGLTAFDSKIAPLLNNDEGICTDKKIIEDYNQFVNETQEFVATLPDENSSISDWLGDLVQEQEKVDELIISDQSFNLDEIDSTPVSQLFKAFCGEEDKGNFECEAGKCVTFQKLLDDNDITSSKVKSIFETKFNSGNFYVKQVYRENYGLCINPEKEFDINQWFKDNWMIVVGVLVVIVLLSLLLRKQQ